MPLFVGFRLSVKGAQAGFFDREKILKAVDRAARRVLSKAGAFIRSDARRSIRSARHRGDHAKPGRPPKSHLGLLKKFLFFSYDQRSRSVVIGPARLSGHKTESMRILEEGGNQQITIFESGKPKRITADYEPRPYMGPALDKNEPKFPSLFARSLR